MADLVVTANSVVKGTGASVQTGTAGVTITAGQGVYLDTSVTPNLWKLAECDDVTAAGTVKAGENGIGIALNGAALNQPLDILVSGQVTIGATVTVGQVYVISATAGGIAPLSDLVSLNRVTALGWGITAAILSISPMYLGVQKP